jgi:hypothetical protein
MTHPGRPVAQIVPPYLLRHLATTTEPIAGFAKATLTRDQLYRHNRAASTGTLTGQRSAMATPAAAAAPSRRISDAGNAQQLPGKTARDEGAPATGDVAVDEAYDGFGSTWKLYEEVYGRNSIDGSGLRLLGSVHYGEGYQNAFWNGTRMVFGDGDGEIFGRFTASLDVIGHELTHGVVEHTAALTYSGQSGALNESISDVFGVLVKQYALGQDAAAADWLIGGDLLLPGVKGVALRSMLHPGTAYDDPRLGPAAGQHERLCGDQGRQRRCALQLGHPEPRVRNRRHHDRRARLGEGRTRLVRRAHRRGPQGRCRLRSLRATDHRRCGRPVRGRIARSRSHP